MMYFTPLPPVLYEIINCALFTSATVVLILCGRYLLTAYFQMRKSAGVGVSVPSLSRFEAFYELRKLRLAVGLTVFMLGESPRMGYLWLSRYMQNTGHDIAWLSQGFWILVPIIGSATAVCGLACLARAIVPAVWGRFGYFGTLMIATAAVVATQIIRDPIMLAEVVGPSAVVLILLLVGRKYAMLPSRDT